MLVAHSTGGSDQGTPATLANLLLNLDGQAVGSIRGWPTEEEANKLLDLVILNVGISQQLFDIRSFLDILSSVYVNPDNSVSLPGLLIVKILLVFAIGRLLEARMEGSELPGASLFKEAMKHLPLLGNLRKCGILGVEVVALVALYLQIADRKDDAYLYVRRVDSEPPHSMLTWLAQANMALRLAVSNDMHRSKAFPKLSRSQGVHRNRLWWSVYMQERCAQRRYYTLFHSAY